MKQYERFIIYGLLLILLILLGWFIDNKAKTERYKCWPMSNGDYVGSYILDTKTRHVYIVRNVGTNIRDLGVIGVFYGNIDKDRPLNPDDFPMRDK